MNGNGKESLIFSVVVLSTNTGISDYDLMNGIPNVDDIKHSILYKELLEDCGGSKYILVSVKSVEIESQNAILVNEMRYAIIPEEIFTFSRRENYGLQSRNL